MNPIADRHFREVAKGGREQVRVFKSGPATWACAASTVLAAGRSFVMVVPGAAERKQAQAHLSLFSGSQSGDLAVFPSFRPDSPRSAWAERWAALYALSRGSGPRGALITADNLLALWPPRRVLQTHHLVLAKGEEILPESILEQAVLWGYERGKMVTRRGEMAVRGDILDIFPPGEERPLRFEFFGDTLTDIRTFDAVSQRSREDREEAVLLPMLPAVSSPDLCDEAQAKWRRHKSLGELTSTAESELCRKLEEGGAEFLPGEFYEDATTMTEWLPGNAVYLLCGAEKLRSRLEELEWAWSGHLEDLGVQRGWSWPKNTLFRKAESARKAWLGKPRILFEELVMGEVRDGVEMQEKAIRSFEDLFWKPEQKNRPWHALVDALKEWSVERPQTILSFHGENSRKRFLKLAEQEGIKPRTDYSPGERGVFALVSQVDRGAELDWNGIIVLPEDVLQPGTRKRAAIRDKDFKGLSSYEDLSPGDLLVHRDFGLSSFEGLTRLEVGHRQGDFLLLRYSGDDKLYLPVDRLNLVQRYKGPEGAAPSLDRLGGTAWTRAKDKARKAVEKIAAELVEIYAYRQVAKGYSYGPLDDMYREFEASFGFEETPDQDRAISEVLADMDGEEPMDRLVCGDVGFGKTEVALRAAFRAALNGKQTALLCPTTVLAEQHFHTFKRRLEEFPVRAAMLSRFVTPARQKEVLAAASRGEVDILIGTHRLLSGDVSLPNLGLLILDEEQRFGVKAKEKFKHFRKNVDVLALTATPIPRTLQLSLSGIRKLSVIETPPEDRKPVRTSLIERDDKAMAAIIQREMERNGQVFWVHNRVQGLERVLEYVRSLAPEARVGMAHGRMREKELEETMHRFWHGELDVLVCTAIIESGLDFPRANTLIVDNAHLFGLGQLYQLRGRVGRSERQAYAYFVIGSLKNLPEQSRRRLRVILEMDYLGAGFQVAREDLRLRGAGNILGEVQSGNIARVGLDLFLEMLNEEVRRIKGEKTAATSEPELGILFDARIPERYLPDAHDRLLYYKALSSAEDDRGLAEITAELRDLYGPLPDEAERFVEVLSLKRVLSKLNVAKADLYPNRFLLSWSDGGPPAGGEGLISWVQDRVDWARMTPPAKLELRIPEKMSIREGMRFAAKELVQLSEVSECV